MTMVNELTEPAPQLLTQSPPLRAIDQVIEDDIREGWKADLSLSFTQRGDKTVLKHRHQSGPLAIQRPLYPDGTTCHAYLLHPPGGVVGGDTLNIDIRVESNAEVLITTPGSTKFYRSNHRYAQQKQVLRVEAGGRLEWFPQDNIFFPHAHVRLDTDIHLEGDAQFWGWELNCFGRPALDEPFSAGHLIGKTQLFIDQKIILTEGIQMVGGDELLMEKGLLNYPLMGTLYIRHFDSSLLEPIQAYLTEKTSASAASPTSWIAGATELEGVIVVRALGHWSEDLINLFGDIWRLTRGKMTGATPDKPRIWAT
ncbi:urease accessory protein UreD [Vibrio ulleungensis]|uniref:Urease accessory protein UreD n=1 Tax=Vibrio ulleungensis TaxID=2807619 RepID=A0ABS2HHC6_9VIBR|nr:urease accessory protein UreD [Vibrio ulleungensis]MBM7036081.1 urease accessory protein UreD [Vibrio ulleungensis]